MLLQDGNDAFCINCGFRKSFYFGNGHKGIWINPQRQREVEDDNRNDMGKDFLVDMPHVKYRGIMMCQRP
jgi:hypothetical protein